MANTIRPLIEEAVKLSMRERNKDKTSTLRMAVSELKKEEIDTRTEITDETSIRILQRMIKQRKESMSQFNDAGREELAEKEALEISILEETHLTIFASSGDDGSHIIILFLVLVSFFLFLLFSSTLFHPD